MVDEEDGVGDGELGVTHEQLQQIMDGVVRVFHAVFSVLAQSRDVVLHEFVGVLVKRIGELEVWQYFVVGIGSDERTAGKLTPFSLGNPMQISHFASKESIHLRLVQGTDIDGGASLLEFEIVLIKVDF